MAAHQSHPLPPPPPGAPQNYPQYQQYQQYQPQQPQQQQQQQQVVYQTHAAQQKPRPKSRNLSFGSSKSQKSSGSHPKLDLHETSAEKEAKRLHSKADPTLAMNEAEPAAVQATVKSSLASLREMDHKDSYGNPISEPDRSNPTRSRWERPLDTIRSFEAAIDGGYSNRKSYIRSDSESVANWNRRSSYYGNQNGRAPHGSYYGGRPQSMMRPEGSQYDMRQRDTYFDPQGHDNGYGPPPPMHGRQRYNRMASEPHFSSNGRGEQNVYPIPNNQRSYETVTSAGGSGTSGEHAGYQTDLTSSDNSSVDRVSSPPKRQEPPQNNDYGIGFAQDNMYQPAAFSVGSISNPAAATPRSYQAQNGGYGAPPPVPQKDMSGVMRHATMGSSAEATQQRPNMGDKRKSWFTRRFSRQG